MLNGVVSFTLGGGELLFPFLFIYFVISDKKIEIELDFNGSR